MEEKTEKISLKTKEEKELGQEKEEKIEEIKMKKENEGKEELEIAQEDLTEKEGNALLQKIEELSKLLQQKEEEFQKEHDRWLRAVAELENYKKRVAREKSEILRFGTESLIKELLPVLD
ncbi:MAG: nucleotide exchange factor GrpE, partial [Desulfobacterota bacterium]|nr:nucleotide exchange factor GrpE [Thermodesulfobacteriota bacterium]